MKAFVVASSLLVLAMAKPTPEDQYNPYAAPAPYQPAYQPEPAPYPAPVKAYAPAPAPYKAAYKAAEPYYEEPPKDYAFGYDVNEQDEYGHPNVHSQHEERNGNVVKGQYTVQLPDCRTQIVDYYTNEYNQYFADVKYEGTPCPDYTTVKKAAYPAPAPAHPQPEPAYPKASYPAPAPAYKPAPAYTPAPAYPQPAYNAYN